MRSCLFEGETTRRCPLSCDFRRPSLSERVDTCRGCSDCLRAFLVLRVPTLDTPILLRAPLFIGDRFRLRPTYLTWDTARRNRFRIIAALLAIARDLTRLFEIVGSPLLKLEAAFLSPLVVSVKPRPSHKPSESEVHVLRKLCNRKYYPCFRVVKTLISLKKSLPQYPRFDRLLR